MRYEAAIDTPLAFREGGLLSMRAAESVSIEFEERRYVWHKHRRDGDRQHWPVLTLLLRGSVDETAVESAISRLLSALSFMYELPMAISATAGTGWKQEFDPPIIGQPGYSFRQLEPPPGRVHVVGGHPLGLVLALMREARSARSPAYRYLAYYNALAVAFDDDKEAKARFIDEQLEHAPGPQGEIPSGFDWNLHFRDRLRNAIAHTIRPPGRPVLNPDDTTDRWLLTDGADRLAALVRTQVQSRWPRPVRTAGG